MLFTGIPTTFAIYAVTDVSAAWSINCCGDPHNSWRDFCMKLKKSLYGHFDCPLQGDCGQWWLTYHPQICNSLVYFNAYWHGLGWLCTFHQSLFSLEIGWQPTIVFVGPFDNMFTWQESFMDIKNEWLQVLSLILHVYRHISYTDCVLLQQSVGAFSTKLIDVKANHQCAPRGWSCARTSPYPDRYIIYQSWAFLSF